MSHRDSITLVTTHAFTTMKCSEIGRAQAAVVTICGDLLSMYPVCYFSLSHI